MKGFYILHAWSHTTFKTYDDDDNDNELFLWYGRLTKDIKPPFPAGIIASDHHHRESPKPREQDLKLRRT